MYNLILKDSYNNPIGCFGEITNIINETNDRVTFVGDGETKELVYNPEYNRWDITIYNRPYHFSGYEILTNNQLIDRAESDEQGHTWYRQLVSEYHITRDHDEQPFIQPQAPVPTKNNKFRFE